MKAIQLIAISLLLICLSVQQSQAKKLVSIDYNGAVICPSQNDNSSPPSFDEENCTTTHASFIDPQNTAIWVRVNLNIPQEMLNSKQPYSVYVSGKTSSKVYFNKHFIGQNGTPNLLPEYEFPGKIDSMFYVPPQLIKQKPNHIALFLSSHHGFLDLKSPLNFIGLGIYSDPTYFIQSNVWRSFIPLGALILGTLYFAVSCFSPYQRRTNVLFLLMSVIAASQLIMELSRALYSYPYPFHDIRLLLIVSLSVSFGSCLLIYIVFKFAPNRQRFWIIPGILLTIIGVYLLPGFDLKTALAIFIPSILSTILIFNQLRQNQTKELFIYLLAFMFVTITIIMNLKAFHDLIFYYVLTGVLGFLFIQQALKLSQEQSKRKEEEQQVIRLQLILDQNKQKEKPNKIKIISAGKIELVSANDISYCKAAGDYAEICLANNKEILFSGNLKVLEKQLPTTFLRVHRSYIVNMDFIVSLKSTQSSSQKNSTKSGMLQLKSDKEVPVSRRIMPMVRSVISR